MTATQKPLLSDIPIVIAVVGEFQIGKSSLVNCLLGRSAAKIGNGWKSQTTTCVDYALSDDVVIVDTPGVNDTRDRDKDALAAIKRAHCVIFVKDNQKQAGQLDCATMGAIKKEAKPCVFVCNCSSPQRSDPFGESNAEFCNDLTNEFIDRNGFSDVALPVAGKIVLPVNILWAQFALGLLEREEQVESVKRRLYVSENFEMEAMRKSNFLPVRDFVANIRLNLLLDYLSRKDSIMRRLRDEFAEKLTLRRGLCRRAG